MTPFEAMYTLTTNNILSEQEIKESGLSEYLLIQYLRGNIVTLFVAQYLNMNMKTMNIYDMYLFAHSTIPKNIRISWIKMTKKPKEEQMINYISEHYVCNIDTAKQYYKLLSDKQLKTIERLYNIDGRI